ncbi:MAG: GNAT family N-acetyltransferase [Verrucomicrobiaceae bacterium]|nr:GNAT family N-acetyltransferase [Verrucomicrobiaceae bacterium]
MNQGSPLKEVRLAEAADVPRIAEIQVLAWRAAYRGIVADSLLDGLKTEDRHDLWSSFVGRDEAPLYVVMHEAQVVGFCHVMSSRDRDSDGAAEIVAIYIDPPHWRRGSGRALVDQAIVFARARSFSILTLWVLEGNTRGRSFYEQVGFLPDGATKHETLGGVTVTELRYKRRVDE